jgi:hypothetical protein
MPVEVSDEVAVGAVAEWDIDARARAGEPFDRRYLAEISLRAPMHPANIRSLSDGTA